MLAVGHLEGKRLVVTARLIGDCSFELSLDEHYLTTGLRETHGFRIGSSRST